MSAPDNVEQQQRVARVHELVCASLAALRDGDRQDLVGARTALRMAAIELGKLAPGGR